MVQKLGRGKTREGWVVHQFYIHTVDGSEILHHLGCLKPCKYRDVYHILPYQLVNAGFQPSTPLETFFFQVIWSHQTRRKHNNFKHHRIHEKMACLPTWVIPYHKKSTIYKMQANIQVPWILWEQNIARNTCDEIIPPCIHLLLWLLVIRSSCWQTVPTTIMGT